ncbi:MAG: GerMN domain-containing protein [Verrucomicrobia bacterium]|nr:GerMN domain-containing protein [Deltaproteobacteria bacterium]
MPTIRRRKINISLLIPFAIVALVFSVLIWKKMQASREVRPVPQVAEPAAPRKGVLFFVTDGVRLVREARELDACGETQECLKDLLDELFSGPVGDLDEALPESSGVKSVRIEGDLAIVDLNQAFASDLAAGSSAEMLAVYSIVDTVCVNYPQIARVKLTVEGNEKTQLRHLDLSDPLPPDYTLEQSLTPLDGSRTTPPSAPPVQKGHP